MRKKMKDKDKDKEMLRDAEDLVNRLQFEIGL
jgi:hypothetical protein